MHFDPGLSLGHAVLDEQHRELIAAAQVVHQAHCNADKGLLHGVEELYKISEVHFALEERLMAETDYHDVLIHTEQHREILGQIDRFRRQLLADRFAYQSAKVARFLQEWVARHILQFDRDLADHLKARQAG